MSTPHSIPTMPNKEANGSPSVSPSSPPGKGFLVPSPVPTRRARTLSQSDKAAAGPSHYGRVKSFCRQKGHGFIVPHEGSEPIFVHISDIEGEFVPQKGDEVEFKRCLIPPKNEKFSAVQLKIRHHAEGVPRMTWDEPLRDAKD